MKKPISQKGKRHHFDALVIGGGIAGLIYALELSQKKPSCKIALIVKKTLSESNSQLAQGGIAAVSLNKDSIIQHIKDTLAAGDGLSDKKMVKAILSAAPAAIEHLQKYGVRFDNHLTQEGGHSHRRVYHVGDKTGQAIIEALTKQVKKLKNISRFEYHTTINLIKQKSSSEVIGAYVLNEKMGCIHTLLAQVIVLATGGAGKIYRYTSNLEVATGDGIAMAYRTDARLKNLEFYQFHPTLLYHHVCNNFLISEAVRGEGARLRNADTGKRFMKRYASKQMELATRDIVSRAIFNEIEHSKKDFVYLDIRHKNRAFLKNRFPVIFKKLSKLGIDMSRDMIPVVPAAHYLCGGIATDLNGKTNIKRLYAIGETACTGLHGANRLASNSLLEAMVVATHAATHSLKWLKKPLRQSKSIKDWDSKSVIDLRRATQIHAHWRGLRGEMMSYAGIVRTGIGLKDLLKLIKTRREMIEGYYWKHGVTRDLVELRNIVLVAELIVRAALRRKESRGSHFREDFPEKSNA